MAWDAALRNAESNPDIVMTGTKKRGGKSGTNAQRVEAFGHAFDSGDEAKRYGVLLKWERLGIISDLVVHPLFVIQESFKHPITKRVQRAVTWRGDYSYTMRHPNTGAAIEIVEDWKGREFPQWKVKRPFIVKALGRKVLFVNRDLNGILDLK